MAKGNKINVFLQKIEAGIDYNNAYQEAGISKYTAQSVYRKYKLGLIKPGKEKLILIKESKENKGDKDKEDKKTKTNTGEENPMLKYDKELID